MPDAKGPLHKVIFVYDNYEPKEMHMLTIIATKTELDELVDRFLRWPLPNSVCSDICATEANYKHPRHGTNLLTATEAREMLKHVFEISSLYGILYTKRQYPCGCAAEGPGDVPAYCAEHGERK